MKHFILTRFNDYFPSPLIDPKLGLSEDWMRHRIDVFNNFTIPSVVSQSEQDFTWIIRCHPRTPLWARDLLKSDFFIASYDEVPYFDNVAKHSCYAFSKVIRRETSDKWIITTRLDNDDVIPVDHIRIVKENIQENKWFDFSKGIVKNKYGFHYHEKQGVSMFCSYMECRDLLKTVYWKYHNVIQDYECVKNTTDLGWMYFQHEHNMSKDVVDEKKYPNKVPFKDISTLIENFPSVLKYQFF